MANMMSLPLELINRIVDLAVEDCVALADAEVLSVVEVTDYRQILLDLSLVAKSFTPPAQLALWRYVTYMDFHHNMFVDISGKDKVIEEFEMNFSCGTGSYIGTPDLLYFLKHISRINSLILCTDGMENSVLDLSNVFSLQNLQEFNIKGFGTVLLPPSLPNLRALTFNDRRFNRDGDDPKTASTSLTIEGIMKSQSKVVWLRLKNFYKFSSVFERNLLLIAPNIRTFTAYWCKADLILVILPTFTSLSKLIVEGCSNSDLPNYIRNISPSAPLVSLSIHSYAYVHVSNFDDSFFINLLKSLPHLKEFYLPIEAVTRIQPGHMHREKEISELCSSLRKGFKIYFKKEEDMRIIQLEESTENYRTRQVVLDAKRL